MVEHHFVGLRTRFKPALRADLIRVARTYHALPAFLTMGWLMYFTALYAAN